MTGITWTYSGLIIRNFSDVWYEPLLQYMCDRKSGTDLL